MPVFGLVLRLGHDDASRAAVLSSLCGDARVEVGVIDGPCCALVLTTTRVHEETAFIDAQLQSGGVDQVDLAYANFEDLGREATGEENDRGTTP